MPDYEARCKLLECENEQLRDHIAVLEQDLGITFDAPGFLQLTGKEAKLFGIFMAREAVTKRLVMDALYGDKPDSDVAEEKIVDVLVCKLRAKLKVFNIEIGTNWGQGYFMTGEMKARAHAVINERGAA